jgi:O-antigen ligase
VKSLYLKNPGFILVCLLIGVSPLMQGSVDAWSQTVIQAMVTLGGILLVMEALLRRRTVPADAAEPAAPLTGGREGAGRRVRRGYAVRELVVYVAIPCAALGTGSAILSPHPALVVEGLLMLAAYLGFFFLVVLTVQSRQEQRILVWVIVWTSVGLGVIGMLKRFDVLVFSWWDYSALLGRDHSVTSLSGVYVNRNHMAGFFEMAIPLMLCLFLSRSRSLEVRLGMIGLALFLLTCQVLTLSRGGWAATAGALIFIAGVLLLKKGFVHKRMVGTLAAGSVILAVVIAASTPVVERAVTLTGGEMEDNLAGRLTYWEGTLRLIADNRLAGTGPGTFTVAFPPYQLPGLPVLPRYAHNDYLQFVADAGIFVVPLMLWLLFLFFRAGFAKLKSRSRQTSGIALGGMAAVVAILIHSFSDGNLHISANALLFTAITALVMGSGSTLRHKSSVGSENRAQTVSQAEGHALKTRHGAE